MTDRFGLQVWWYLELEPAYANLRKDPWFQEILVAARNHIAGEREALDKLRASGLAPDRTKSH
ncbi:MAG TPA: hypothetical protein VGD47_10020 [Steroidobacteraceae bacterium]